MKNRIVLLCMAVCLCMAIPAQAQLNWGVKGGLNLTDVSFDKSAFSSDNTTGFFIGPMVEDTLPLVGLGIDGALLYSQKKIKAEYNGVSETGKQQGIDIPINLKYSIGLGSMASIFIAAGPDFYFDFAKTDFADLIIGGDEVDASKNRAQVGLNVGAGVKLVNHLQIGVNYNIPLGNSGDVTIWDGVSTAVGSIVNSSSYKTKTWQVSVAYLF